MNRNWAKIVSGVLALLVAATILVAIPVPPADAAACDANGDGRSTGRTTTWVSTGDDGVADELEEKAGYIVPDPTAAYNVSIPVCVELLASGIEAVDVIGTATEVLDPMAPWWEANAISTGLSLLPNYAPRPVPQLAPAKTDLQVVGLESWLWIDATAFTTITWTRTVGAVTVTFVATPTATQWSFADEQFDCAGPGVPWVDGSSGTPACGKEWAHTSAVEPQSVETEIVYSIVWTSSLGATGVLVENGPSAGVFPLDVGEIQSVGTLGDEAHPDDPGLTPELVDPVASACSLTMIVAGYCSDNPPTVLPPVEVDEGCNGLWGCFVAVVQVGGEVLQEVGTVISDAVLSTLGPVVDFIKGCAAFVGESLGAIWDTVSSLATDPVGYVQEQYEMITMIVEALQGPDADEFIVQFLGDIIDIELMQENPAEWAGKIGCELASMIFSGGAAGGARAARLLDRMSDIRRWLDGDRTPDPDAPNVDRPDGDGPDGDSNGNNGNDNDGDVCPLNSFPVDTPVLMADGTVRPIQYVNPGDLVLAGDGSGQWQPRMVLDHWSRIDDSPLLTVTLIDGSAVTATNDHQFWVNSTGWVELDEVTPGDRLATPTGPVLVAAVDVTDPDGAVVWDMTVAVDHTFGVGTGTTVVLVHNDCRRPQTSEDLNVDADTQAELQQLGISPETVARHWDEYLARMADEGRDPITADVWLSRYKELKRSQAGGAQFELDALAWFGKKNGGDLPKNTVLFPDGDGGGFIPDGLRDMDGNVLHELPPSGAPVHFIEVKNRQDLFNGGNLSNMLDYLETNGGSMTLILNKANRTHLSAPLLRRIADLNADGVVVDLQYITTP